jgi:cation transport ATPase
MMTLISLAITVAFGTSLAATFGLIQIEVWWELASLITVMLSGALARNASRFSGSRRAQCTRRATAGHCRTGARYGNWNGSNP